MQFSKLFGVTLLAMASSAQAQKIEYDPLDTDPADPTVPPEACDDFRKYAGYIPRASAQSDVYWVNDQVQGAFEAIMADESCSSVATGKTAWTSGSISSYLQSLPTQPAPISNEWKEYTKYYKKLSGGVLIDNPDFHIDWVNAAFNCGTTAGFAGPSAGFDPDFDSAYCTPPSGSYQNDASVTVGTEVVTGKECVGVEESVKKASSYVFQFIEMVQLMEKAIQTVSSCIWQEDMNNLGPDPNTLKCTTAVEYWDAAAAIFTGSLEGEEGGLLNGDLGEGAATRDYGKTLYTLAEKRCRNFNTCNPLNGDEGAPDRYKTASINSKILQFFAAGSHATYSGDKRRMEYFKRRISAKVMVPWTQGVFRYAWRLSNSNTLATGITRQHKEIAEASTFALGAIPKLWACSIKAAEAVAPLLRTGNDFGPGNGIDFVVIKAAFECNYRCLGITCEEVGELFDGDASVRQDAEACKDKDNLSGDKEVALCVKPNSKYNKKCKKYVGKSGISARTNLDYFIKGL